MKEIQNNKDTVGLLWSPLSTWPCYLSLASKLMGRKNLVLQVIRVLTVNVEQWGWASYSSALIFRQTASAVILLQFKTLPIKHYFVFSSTFPNHPTQFVLSMISLLFVILSAIYFSCPHAILCSVRSISVKNKTKEGRDLKWKQPLLHLHGAFTEKNLTFLAR